MLYAIDSPISGDYSDPRLLGELAYLAEQSGWDGFFIWDHLSLEGTQPIVDPWVALSVMAARTERIRIGTAVTPIPRRRPWRLARETASVDRLSGGRLTLGVGLGEPADSEYERFGEDGSLKTRAAKLDEGLDVLTGLWSGEPFSYHGEHFRVEGARFLPRPVQQPRIPIWVGGQWPNRPPWRRAARWDGVYPIYWQGEVNAMTPEILKTNRRVRRRGPRRQGAVRRSGPGGPAGPRPDEAARHGGRVRRGRSDMVRRPNRAEDGHGA